MSAATTAPKASAEPATPGSGIVGVSTAVYPQDAQPKVTLGYWSMRGLAQAIRYVLAYSGVPFADVRYQQGAAPDFSRAAWLEQKEHLPLDFPNLPYYIEPAGSDATASDDSIALTQSTTILRHLGRKHNLVGTNLREQARCDLVLDTAYDFKSILVDTAYSRQRHEAFQHFATKTVPHYFNLFEAYFARFQKGQTSPSHATTAAAASTAATPATSTSSSTAPKWAAGDSLTIADFFLYEMLTQSSLMVPGCLDSYPHLKQFVANFAALPQIQTYMKSAHFISRPCNNMAGFQ